MARTELAVVARRLRSLARTQVDAFPSNIALLAEKEQALIPPVRPCPEKCLVLFIHAHFASGFVRRADYYGAFSPVLRSPSHPAPPRTPVSRMMEAVSWLTSKFSGSPPELTGDIVTFLVCTPRMFFHERGARSCMMSLCTQNTIFHPTVRFDKMCVVLFATTVRA